MRPLALPSEIMRLENLHGYLKFPGPCPVARIRLDYVKRPKAAESFIPREDAPILDMKGGAGIETPGTVDTPADEERGAACDHESGESDAPVPSGNTHESGRATESGEAEAKCEQPAPPPDSGLAGSDQAPETPGAPLPAVHSAEGDDAGAADDDEQNRGEDGEEAGSRTPNWL